MSLTKNSPPSEVRSEWVKALRSGDYEQGFDRLRWRDQFCCLGVLCDLAAKVGIGDWQDERFIVEGNPFGSTLPGEVATWAGVPSNPLLIRRVAGLLVGSLVEANDEGGCTFGQIADVIERGGVETID